MARILLAEDDLSMCTVLQAALEKVGHEVTICHDGLEALKEVERKHNQPFDLLLTDIVMPGIDGIELSQKAVKLHPELKVMFITGFAAVAVDRNMVAEANAKILSKPFHLNELVKNVEILLAA